MSDETRMGMLRRRLMGAGLWLLGMTWALGAVGLVAAMVVPLPSGLSAGDAFVLEYADGTPAHVLLASDGRWRIDVALDAVDPAYVRALIRLEDKRFYAHLGVDPIAVARATIQNLRRQEVVSGASTLTLQLVRLLEPRPRTLRSKLVEALRAFQLELRLSKDEILRAYLRRLPFGHNVEGVEAAALTYFGHGAGQLSPGEIATLLAVPQGPSTRAPSPAHARRLREARDGLAEWLLARHALPQRLGQTPEDVLNEVRAEHLPTAYLPMPAEAPHAAQWFKQHLPRAGRVRSTLRRDAQRAASGALAQIPRRHVGVRHGAVMVFDQGSGTLRALVGNPSFGQHPGDQLIAFATPRPLLRPPGIGTPLRPPATGTPIAQQAARRIAALRRGRPSARRFSITPLAFAEAMRGLFGAENGDLSVGLMGYDAWAIHARDGQVSVVWLGNLDRKWAKVLKAGEVASALAIASITQTE